MFFFEESLDRLGVRDVDVTDLKTTVRTHSSKHHLVSATLRVEAASRPSEFLVKKLKVLTIRTLISPQTIDRIAQPKMK